MVMDVHWEKLAAKVVRNRAFSRWLHRSTPTQNKERIIRGTRHRPYSTDITMFAYLTLAVPRVMLCCSAVLRALLLFPLVNPGIHNIHYKRYKLERLQLKLQLGDGAWASAAASISAMFELFPPSQHPEWATLLVEIVVTALQEKTLVLDADVSGTIYFCFFPSPTKPFPSRTAVQNLTHHGTKAARLGIMSAFAPLSSSSSSSSSSAASSFFFPSIHRVVQLQSYLYPQLYVILS